MGEYREETVAVKKVKDPDYCKDISLMGKLRHPNIIRFMLVWFGG